jgi:hypothetical protein
LWVSATNFYRNWPRQKSQNWRGCRTPLNTEKGFRVGSRFRFEDLIHVAQPASPLRYVADIFLGLVRGFAVIKKEALTFCDYLVEINSTRVQSDVMDRVQNSRGQLEAETRKLLHEVTRIATVALEHAREAKTLGSVAMDAKLGAIGKAENEIAALLCGENVFGSRHGNAIR